MKLLKPGWVHLDGRQIFSVDIDSRGRFLAIAGQGENNCGKIAVFNFEHFLKYSPNSNNANIDDDMPRKLFEMSNHLGCVNCVRWSPNGTVLASGSDDRLVMIWQPAFSSSSLNSNGGLRRYPDQCRCIAMLREHTGDVLDLAWSHDGSLLATCSIDNSIIVWNVAKLPVTEKVVILKKHSGLVKGISFDPAGVYLASHADDKTLLIWRTADWSVETKITEPFKKCSGSTHVLRLSWAPDGQTLVTAHAMNSGGPTAQLVARGPPWSTNVDLAGHRRAVTCTRFHPRIFMRTSDPLQASQNGSISPEPVKSETFCAVAVGSRDRSVSVWLTYLRRPRLVLQDIFSDSVLDLAWYGHCLVACSNDGTIGCVVFAENELGKLCSEKETAAALHSACANKDYKRPEKVIIQSAALLAERKKLAASTAEQDNAQKPQKPVPAATSAANDSVVKNGNANATESAAATVKQSEEQLPSNASATATPATTATPTAPTVQRPAFLATSPSPFPSAFPSSTDLRAKCLSPQPTAATKQVETKLPNGRRRITPMVVALEPLSPNGLSLFDSIQNGSFAGDNFRPQTATPAPPAVSTPSQAAAPPPPSVTAANDEQAKPSIVQTTAIVPADGTATGPQQPGALPTAKQDDVVKVTASRFVGAKPTTEELKVNKPSATKRTLIGASSSAAQLKRKPGRPPLPSKSERPKRHNRIESSSSGESEVSSEERSSTAAEQPAQKSEVAAPPVNTHFTPALLLSPAKLANAGKNLFNVNIPTSVLPHSNTKQLVISVSPLGDQSGMWLLECLLPPTVATTSAIAPQQRLWLQLLPAQCVAFTVSKNIVAVADSSARVSVFVLKTGARLAGPHVLPSQVAFLESTDWRCLVVLTSGALRIWDTRPPGSSTCLLSVATLPLLRESERYRRCFIAENGSPVLLTSLNRSFLYSNQIQEWLELGESVSQSMRNDSENSLSRAISLTGVSLGHLSAKSLGNMEFQRAALKDALGRNVILARETRNADDYLTAVMAYFRFLVKEDKGSSNSVSYEAEIRDIFGSLMISVDLPNGKSFLSAQVRSDLLRDLLACLATNLRYQQLYVEIESQIHPLTSEDDARPAMMACD